MQYIGLPDNRAKYKCKVKFVNTDHTEGVGIMYLSRSFGETLDGIFKAGNCGKLHYDGLRRVTSQDAYTKFKLEILKFGN